MKRYIRLTLLSFLLLWSVVYLAQQHFGGGGGSGSPGGANTYVTFNDSGAFNSDSAIQINKTTHTAGFNGVAQADSTYPIKVYGLILLNGNNQGFESNSTGGTWISATNHWISNHPVSSTLFQTNTNCADGTATPADCTAAPAGAVIISAAATTVVVNTTIVTANSQIFITEDSSLGTRLSVTCNTTTGRVYTTSARTAGTSFTITASAAPATNPACLNYLIIN